MTKHLKGLLFLLALFCFGLNAHTQNNSSAPQNIYLILDGSGSMWQKVDGEFKIAIARQVVKQLVGDLPAETQLGLVVYGHRKKGDCSDIEVLSPLGKIDKTTIGQQVDDLNPIGMTPITASIEKTLALIKESDQQATVILVSDGLETCEGDPCKAVQLAKAEGLPFVLHVVGFGIEDDDVSQLECAAQAGGGNYFKADDAKSLMDAMDQAVDTPVEEGGAVLGVKVIANDQLQDAMVRVWRNDSVIVSGRTYEGDATNPRYLSVNSGTYKVEVKGLGFKGNVNRIFPEVTLTKGDTVFKTVDFSPGTLKIGITKNEELGDATVRVYEAGTNKQVASSRSYKGEKTNPVTFELTPGTYDVVVSCIEIANKPTHKFEGIVVEGGKEIRKDRKFESGTLTVGVTHNGQLVDATVNIHLVETGYNTARGRTYMSPSSNPKTFTLSPGEYEIKIRTLKPKEIANQKKSVKVVITPQGEVKEIVAF